MFGSAALRSRLRCILTGVAIMEAVLLTIHLIVTIALIGVILLQRSEGGALGIGGSGGGNLFSARGAANALTRTTAILAIVFFSTSIALTILSVRANKPKSVLDQAAPVQQQNAPTTPVLPKLPSKAPELPAAPTK